jgi:protoheme IX farnesyltransferase
VLGAVFLVGAHRLERGVAHGRKVKPMTLFHLSIQYLTLLFVLVAVDALVF